MCKNCLLYQNCPHEGKKCDKYKADEGDGKDIGDKLLEG